MILLPHFTRSILVRSLLAWVFFRGLAAAGSAALSAALGMPPPDPLRLDPRAALLVLAVAGVLGWVSARRTNLDLFLLALGYGRARLLATIVLPPALAELAIQVAARP